MSAATLRLAVYNIWKGGGNRLDRIARTLSAIDADAVGLCEADDPEVVAELAHRLGMDFILAESGADCHHVALLSRSPILRTVHLGARLGLRRSALEALLQTEAGSPPLRLALAHLPSGLERERLRLAELDRILAALDEQPHPTVLLGDLNASAPYHPLDPDALSPTRRARLEAHGGRYDHDVVRRLSEMGWTDAYHTRWPRHPSHTLTTGYPARTVDYIWLDGATAERLIDAGVYAGPPAAEASDHFPVWASLEPSKR